MRKRVLKSRYYNTYDLLISGELLLREYLLQTRERYNVSYLKIKDNDKLKFFDLQKHILSLGINSLEYTWHVFEIYNWLVTTKKMNSIPVNIFLSNKNIKKIFDRKSQFVITPEEQIKASNTANIMESEVKLGLFIIEQFLQNGASISEQEAYSTIMLSKDWENAVICDKRPMTNVLTMLANSYGVKYAPTYLELATLIKRRSELREQQKFKR